MEENKELQQEENKDLQQSETEETVVETVEEISEIEKLQQEIQVMATELEKTKNSFYKAYADTENMKKRLQQDAELTRKYRAQDFVKNILPALDNLDRCLEQKDGDFEKLYKAVTMVKEQLMNALTQEGVKEIEALNLKFDPNLHQALISEKVEGVDGDVVVEVLQKGYTLKDRIIRASLVKVSE